LRIAFRTDPNEAAGGLLTQDRGAEIDSKEGIAMRMLLTLTTIVAAMLVPWNSLAPSWLPDASGSSIEPSSDADAERSGRPAARLNPAWGIVPLAPDEAEGLAVFGADRDASDEPTQGAADHAGTAAAGDVLFDPASDVKCENGVCVLPDGSRVAESALRSSGANGAAAKVNQARERLDELGATQSRIERVAGSDEFRCSCSVPVSEGSRLARRFEATARSEIEAVELIVAQIAQWRRERAE
jgi:hypothetical protein